VKKQLLLKQENPNRVFNLRFLKSRPAFAGLLFGLLAGLFVLAGCAPTGQLKANLGQQFSLAINQTAVISGENLSIKFLDVNDSRCPIGATCIWAGEARATVQINGASDNVTLVQPGYSTDNAYVLEGKHMLNFQVQPYPVVNQTIELGEYRLVMTVNNYSIHPP